ncbi:MAG: histidine kinase, partial [Lachnospiraceae bacterium]|nr:histidine kinase [Lachnospiraceae bacterium]
MYRIVMIIQIVSITVTLAECWVVFKSWKGIQHSYLFLACIATLVNNLGYYFQLRSHSVENYMSALRISYAGRVWVTFSLFMFVMELAKIRIPNAARLAMALFNVISYLIVVTTNRTGLYYKISGFQVRGRFPFLVHTDGWYHHVWSAVNASYAVLALAILFIYYSREKNKIAEKRYLMVMLAMATMSGFFVISILKPLSYNYLYDVTMLSFPIAAVFMFVAIFKYNLLDTATLARDYVIDRLSEAIIAVDDTGEISYANEPAVSVFPKLISDPHSVMDTIRSAIESDEPIRIRDRIYTPEANTLSDSGVSAGRIYTVVDDTQHYMYMEQLEEQKRMADEANRAKSLFLANMSHEIRTPINAVLGMDEMIIRESGEKNIRSYARDIKTAGRTLLSLINDILDFSKIEEGRMEIIPTQYDLSSVINDLVNMTRSRTEKKGLRFNLCVDRNVPHILYGDEIRIKQVALNLLTNAAKYTNEGHVGLNVGYRKKDDENIILSFEIDDSGIGMKEEDMDKLFSPFSRIDEKKNRSVEGTGLGMSIVRQLLDLMGSSLTVDSKLGKGSKFSFEIEQKVIRWEPIGDISERFNKDGDENDVYRELFHAPDANILVVDDTEVNLSVFCNLLKQTKINIDTAASGLSALALAKD